MQLFRSKHHNFPRNFRNHSIACLITILLGVSFGTARAQLLGITGANHPELHWKQIETKHFVLVYHQGLDSIAQVAAPIAEEVYHVVTTNLQTPLTDKVRIYLSDNDEVRNAFTFGDEYIFIWMRGILDDNLFSLRSSGSSKWLRTVITHEFTHIVIAHATKTWEDVFFSAINDNVPRWFNEGMARYMEPDGWTQDLDIPLRVSAVSGKLDLGSSDNFLSGTLMYEAGQSLVRYVAWKYGDSSLVKILKYRNGGLFPYDFDDAVQAATSHSLDEIYDEWHKILDVYYNTQFGQYEDVEEFGRKISSLDIVEAARLAPDSMHIAVLGKSSNDEPTKLYLLSNDTGGEYQVLTDASGIEPYLSWSPDGRYVLFSKIRFGEHADLIYDLYRVSSQTGELHRISSNERLEYPDYSPDGRRIVAVQFHRSGSDLVLLDADGSNLRRLTNFNDEKVQVYSPRFSPDGSRISFSIFRKNGQRDIAILNSFTHEITYLTDDSINDRYPIWNGDSIIFLSFQNGIPNLYSIPTKAGGDSATVYHRELTAVASNITAWDVAKDSILVSAFTERNSVQLFWIPANRTVTPRTPAQPVEQKYSAWRNVRWSLVTPPTELTLAVPVSEPASYNSFAHVRSLVFLPLVGTDIDRVGATGLLFGAATGFVDELQKHLFEGFAWYGDRSHTLSGGIEYQNNQLLPTITIGAQDVLEFRDVIQDFAYYERTKSANLGINFALHTPNSLTNIHNIFIGAEWNNFEPWNLSQFSSVDSNKRPIAARMLDLALRYNYVSSHFQFGASAMHADKSVASTLTWTRLRATLAKQLPLDENDETQFAMTLRAAADYGDELPQDYLGFYKYDAFEGGFNVASLHANDRLRGIRRYVYGNRLLSTSFELREKDDLFSSLVPLLKAFDPQFVQFYDIGTAWYANAPMNNAAVTTTSLSKTKWLKSAGMELRSDVGFGAALEGGVGWELPHSTSPIGGPPDWFLRISGIF